MGCSASSIDTESNTISSDAQRKQAKISPLKLQDELQECVVESQNEPPNGDCTKDRGSVRSFPLLNDVLENATASRSPSGRSKHSIRSHRSNNGDLVTGEPFAPERPISTHSNKSRRSTSSLENRRSLKSPNSPLKHPHSNVNDVEVEGKSTCPVAQEDGEVLETVVTSANNRTSEMKETGENGNAQGLKESQNMEFPSASKKYRTEMPVVESSNENQSEDEGIGFEKLDTISFQDEKYLASENPDQLLEANIFQSSYWEDLGINIGAPTSVEKSTENYAAASIDDIPEVELTLPNKNEEISCVNNKDEEKLKNDKDEKLLTQDPTSTKELRIDIHEREEVLQQSEGGGQSKSDANDNEALQPLWMEKKENKYQNDDSAISLSDLLSDIDSSEEVPCSLAASSSGLVLPRPATSKRREDISNSEILDVPCATMENGASKYIDTIEIDALNEINNNIDKENNNNDANSVDEAEPATEEQRNEDLEVLEEGLSSSANVHEQSIQNNEGDSASDLVEIASRETYESDPFAAAQSVQNSDIQDEGINNEDILPIELSNEIMMTNENEAALLEAADENLLVLHEENNEIGPTESQNENQACDVHAHSDEDYTEPLNQNTVIDELQQNEIESSPYQTEFDKSEEEQPLEVNNNDDTIESNEGSEINNNNDEDILIRQNDEAVVVQDSDCQQIQQVSMDEKGNINEFQDSEKVETQNEAGNFSDLDRNSEIQINGRSKEDDCLFEWSSEDERIVRMLKDDDDSHEKNNEMQKEGDELKKDKDDLQKGGDSLKEAGNGLQEESGSLQEIRDDLQKEKDDFNNVKGKSEIQGVSDDFQENSDQLQEESNDLQTVNDNLQKENRRIQKESGQLQKESDDFQENNEIQEGNKEEQVENMQYTSLPEDVIKEQENEVIDYFVETRKKEANLFEQVEDKIDELLNKDDISEVSETVTVSDKIQKVIRFVLPDEDDHNSDIEPINAEIDINSSGQTENESSSEVQDYTMNSRQRELGGNCEGPSKGDEDVRKKIILDLTREVSFKGCKLDESTGESATDSTISTLNISKQTSGSQEDLFRSVSRQSVSSMTLKLGDISNLNGVEIKHVGRITSQKSPGNIDKETSEGDRSQPVLGF